MDFGKIWGVINNALGDANIIGTLDGVTFQEISFRGSGRRAFVVKGWCDTKEGPAVRFRADWNNLDDGELFYQEHPGDKGWQETEEKELEIVREDGRISIVMSFQTDDGIEREVSFTADINIEDLLSTFLG